MKLENNYTQIHTSISICAFPLFHTKVKIDRYYQLKMGVMAQKYDQLDAKRHLILSIALNILCNYE
jgi:hypothetical protein